MSKDDLKIRRTPTNRDYSLAVCTLASGSKGNATYISDGETSILIDAGLSGTEIQRRFGSHKGIVKMRNGHIMIPTRIR